MASIGIPVFPCDQNKRPLVKWKAGATTDLRQIERYWRKWPAALPAFPTGAASGFDVLDLDRKDGKDGFAALAARGIDPATLSPFIVETASGGWHVYFAHVPGLRCSVGQEKDGLAGVDVRAEGGFAVAPGAIRPTGGYRFVSGDLRTMSLVDLPPWPATLPVQPRPEQQGATGAAQPSGLPLAVLRDAVMALPLDVRQAEFGTDMAWFKVARIIFDETGGSEEGNDLWHEWSEGWGGYDHHVAQSKWNRSDDYTGQRATVWTILNPALAAGWSHPDFDAWRAAQAAEEAAGDFPDDALALALTGDLGTPLMQGDRPIINLTNTVFYLGRNLDSILPGLHHDLMTGRDEWRDGPLTDAALALARTALERKGLATVGKELVADAAKLVARHRQCHPIRDALALLRHDGKPRLNTWLIDHAGAEDTPYTRAVSRAFLLQMVARVMQPGCKADHTLVLSGPQGQSKSTACRVLAGAEYFSDTLPSITGDKTDAIRHLQGKWLIELAELAPSRRSEAEDLKSFLSGMVDRVRLPYARLDESFPRQCVFVGTTNEDQFLRDATGGRRFWPVAVRKAIDIEALAEERDQLFAEAVAAFHAGERWWLDRDFEAKHARPVQAAAYVSDSWKDTIGAWLDAPDLDGRARDSFSISEVLLEALHIVAAQQSQPVQKRAATALRLLGWKDVKSHGRMVWRRVEG
ncbi:MAG: VapE domain-containing protein [Gemmobacter sp.]